ncbi:MAG: hypothetical protein QG556_741 [Pseudomonadota bacterium]|nr:hypothetical protein [Pseudomonadota bacterium]
MKNVYEYLIEKYLDELLKKPAVLLYAIQQKQQISGDNPNSLLENISTLIIQNSLDYQTTGRPIGGECFCEKAHLTLFQKIILESILDYVLSLVIKDIGTVMRRFDDDIHIKLNENSKAYENNLRDFLIKKLLSNDVILQLPSTPTQEEFGFGENEVQDFDKSYNTKFFNISDAEIQENNLKTFKQVIQECLNADKIESSEAPCSFCLGIWQKICEFFLWIWEKFNSSLSTPTCNA